MKIKLATFIKSSANVSECPPDQYPEYAFIGRSNVGKSSLINRLTNQKKLAKTSQTPGKTQLINHYLIHDSWYLVDLPGYGWAKLGKVQKQKLAEMIQEYMLKRTNLTGVFVLVDSRHKAQDIDLDFMQFLGENQVPFVMVFTKIDKLKPGQLKKNIEAYRQELLEEWEEMPTHFITSSVNGEGCEEILRFIAQVNQESIQ